MGAVSATGAAGGGWLIAGAGSAATKLAVGCLLALGVGAGCMALGGTGRGAKDASHAHAHAHRASAGAHATPLGGLGASVNAAISRGAQARARTHIATLAASRRAPREFGLEGAGAVPTSRAAAEASAPRALSAAVTPARDPQAGTSPSTPSRSAEPSATAAREFGPE
jgi:hypothetical protein